MRLQPEQYSTYSPEELEAALGAVDSWQLAIWGSYLNRGIWPDDFPLPPRDVHGTVPGTHEAGMASAYSAWKYCQWHTMPAERSKAWWMFQLQRPEADWQAYWEDRDDFG